MGCSRDTLSYIQWHASDTQWHAPSDPKIDFADPLQIFGESSELATQEWIGGLLGPQWKHLIIDTNTGIFKQSTPLNQHHQNSYIYVSLQLKLQSGSNLARIPEFYPGCHHPGKHHFRCHHVAELVLSLPS